jgi:hypothetical protein
MQAFASSGVTTKSGSSVLRLCLQPQMGLYVKGFGQAYRVNPHDLIDVLHLTEGHRSQPPSLETDTSR